MKKIKNPLILLAFATTAICGLGLAAKTSSNAVVPTFATYTNHDADTYYSDISDSLTGSSLLSALQSLNSSKRKTTVGYSGMGVDPSGQFKYTDYDPDSIQYDSNGQPYGTRLITFYSGNSATSGMNREHVWPKSHGGNSVEGDIHMPRPTLNAENGSRGNSFYVEGKCDGSSGWDPAMESFGVESYRGDSARIILYCCVAESKLSLLEADSHPTSNSNRDNLMGKLSDLIKWHLKYPVLEREKNRNEGAEYLQGNRNPFIDHRSYACKIWGNSNSTTKSLCDQYNGWTDGDEPTPTKTLDSIVVKGTPSKTSYTAGEHFNTAGLTVTAYYSDSTNENVTSKVTVSPDPLTAGTTSVTLSYKYGNDTKTEVVNGITVSSGEVTNYGTLENPISVSQAKLIIENECTGSSACYTKQQIYCRGIAGSFLSSEDTNYRHKMYVRDVNSSSSVVTLNSLNMSEEQYERLEEGDTIVFHGYGYKEGTTTDYFKYNGNYEVTLDKNESKSGDVPITSLIINNKTKDYFIGQTCTLDITVFPAYATDTITYKSNNISVASVDTNGKVTFKAAGSATITATAKSGVSASITFNVIKSPVHVESVSASLPSNSYYVGDTANIQYSVSPDDADNKDVSFSSSNTSVATVDASGNITFKAAGSVVFTVASKENSSIKDTISVSVSNRPAEDIPVESVSLSVAAGSSEFEVGDEVQINATITPANATNKHLTYSSNNTDIATVTSNGLVSFKAVGNVIITATSNNGKTSQLSFTVKDSYVPVTSVSLSTEKTNVVVGEKVTLNVSVLPENATDKTLVFSSTNEEIAKVINNEVSFNKSGRVVIKATATNGVYGEIEFTVSEEHIPVTSISVSLDKTSFKVGETATANVSILPEDATNKSVKFSSSNEEVARIDSDTGDVEFIKEGSVTFTVKSLDNNSLSASVVVTVVAREEPIRISILENPHKTTYSPNEQFDPTGLVVVADYLDGCSIKIDGENLTLSAPDMSTSGFKTITVSYKNTFTTTFNILVLEVEPSDLIIEKYPSKTTYYKSEEFNPIGMKVYAVIGDKKEDVSDIVTFDYDFEVSTKVTVRFKGLWKIINIIIETGEITNEHKAADFAYIVKDVLEDVSVNDLTLADWNAFEHYYNSLDEAAKKVLRETVTKYSANSVQAAEDLTATLKQCVENYDEIYLNHKNQGFRDFMGRNPVKPNDSDKKDQSNNLLLILIGIGAGVVLLIVLIIIISVSAAKRSKKKHAK